MPWLIYLPQRHLCSHTVRGERSPPATFSDLGRRDTPPTPPVRPDTLQTLRTMLKSITSSQFSPPLNTAVTSKKKKNWVKRQRKTLKLVKNIKKAPKHYLRKSRSLPKQDKDTVDVSCPQSSQLTLTQRCPRSWVFRLCLLDRSGPGCIWPWMCCL